MPPLKRSRRIITVSGVAALTVLVVLGVGIAIGRATKTASDEFVRWRALPEAPIVGRLGAGVVWTGAEMIVWGGGAPSTGPALGGAAFEPGGRTWRRLAEAPSGLEGGAAVVWTGREMLVWASNSPDGPVGAAAYDPVADSWRPLPAGPLGRREGFSVAWTGRELLVVGGNLGDTLAQPVAAALDPAAGTWRLLPALNRLKAVMPGSRLVWSGREAFLRGAACEERASCRSVFLAYDPTTDVVRRLDLAEAPTVPGQELSLVGTSNSEIIFTIIGVSSNVNRGRIAVVRYDPQADSWRKGVFAPFPGTEGVNQQIAWLGDRLVVPDGSSGLQIYSLATDSWRTITPGPSPLNWRTGSAVAWTGTELIAWSGLLFERLNPTPNSGASLDLRE